MKYNMEDRFVIDVIEKDDYAYLADLHQRAFLHGWDQTVFEQFLSAPFTIGFIARPKRKQKLPLGFVIARLIAGEAEIITILVDPRFQGYGIGQALMDRLLRHLHHERAEKLFLEVDENNHAALALYRRFNFELIGKRENYYHTGPGQYSNALVLQRSFPRYKVDKQVDTPSSTQDFDND